MKSIKENYSYEYIINKSKFICLLFKVNSLDDINNYLDKIKTNYKDATHYCYSYILDNIKRFNDDGEPSGTAGMPILNVLESNNLNHVLCIVVRYFGGIKLGAGGLVRAYTKSVTLCLENVSICNLLEGYLVDIIFDYNNSKPIDNLLKKYDIISKDFNEVISYKFIIDKNDYDLIYSSLNNLCNNINIEKNILITD